MTEDEILDFARALLPRWDGGWLIDDRPVGAFEMMAMRTLKNLELEERIKTHGCCCDEGPYESTGRCRKRGGKCELLKQAERLIGRHDYAQEHD